MNKEIEALSEDIVKYYANKLGFNFETEAYFGSVDILYKQQYGISKEDFCRIANITFDNNKLEKILKNYKYNNNWKIIFLFYTLFKS